MALPIPVCLEDFSTEDLRNIAWDVDFLEQATPLERLLLQRLDDACTALDAEREDVRRLLDHQWERT